MHIVKGIKNNKPLNIIRNTKYAPEKKIDKATIPNAAAKHTRAKSVLFM